MKTSECMTRGQLGKRYSSRQSPFPSLHRGRGPPPPSPAPAAPRRLHPPHPTPSFLLRSLTSLLSPSFLVSCSWDDDDSSWRLSQISATAGRPPFSVALSLCCPVSHSKFSIRQAQGHVISPFPSPRYECDSLSHFPNGHLNP